MAPVNKMRTYGRPNRSLVNNLDAGKLLFIKNKTKQRKKRKLVIKELPARTVGESLLGQDSFHVSTEDTFDKLAKGSTYNPVNIKSHISIVNHSDSNVSKSIKRVDSFYSPIITRRRKKSAFLMEVSSNSDIENKPYKKVKLYSPIMTRSKKSVPKIDISNSSKNISEKHTNNSIFPRFKEPTIEKIDCSLEVEKVRNQIPKSLSYIVIPDMRESETSINAPRDNVSAVKGDLSFDTIFTKTFREKQLIHSSTPLVPTKLKKVINYTISPIKNINQSNSKNELQISNAGISKISSSSLKSRENTNIEYIPEEDWKLIAEPIVILDFCPEIASQTEVNYAGFESTEKVQSEVALRQFHKIVYDNKNLNFVCNAASADIQKGNMSRPSFITLRKRRILKSNSLSNKSRKRSSKGNTDTADQNLTRSECRSATLDDFNAFIDKMNSENASKLSSHSLSDFELFEKQNQDMLAVNVFKDTTGKAEVRHTDSSRNFVNKRRRRLTDSYLMTNKKQKTVDLASSKEKKKRRLSYPDESFVKNPEVPLQDVVVLVPKIKNITSRDNSTNNLTTNSSRTSSESNSQTRLTNFSDTDTSANGSSEVSDNDFFRLKHPIFKDVVVDIKKLNLQSNLCCTSNSIKSFSDKSKSLFEDYSINSNANRNYSVSVACQTLYNDISINERDNPSLIKQNFSITSLNSNILSQQNDAESVFKDEVSIQEQNSHVFSNISQNNDQVGNSKEEKSLDISAEDFENFFENITKRSKGIKRFEFKEICRSNSGELSYANIAPQQDDAVDNNTKDLIVNLIKSPWRKKNKQSIPIPKSNTENTVVDLTGSLDEKDVRKSDAVIDISALRDDEYKKHSISDIIESSVLESSQMDADGFKIPILNSTRKRHSKTLVLKAGKLWRRSFSMYKRSSVMLTIMNQDVCRLADGNFCACPKCSSARQCSRISNRRNSIRIVPAEPMSDAPREISVLENYAHNTSYVSDRILEDNLENDLRSLSLSKRKTSIVQNSAPVVTARELVLKKCGQEEPLPFEECYSKSLLHNCQKIGEGVYGEVFLFKNPNGGTSVMKVIPIEGDLIVNGERQKKFDEILSEITIAMELSNLRNNKHNKTSGFSEVQKVCCVQGQYPEKLLYLWELYDETRGSENDSPEIFGEDQLYIVLQLANGGTDLEAFIFNNSLQAYTTFQQVACALAVAEEELHFEHRDLHWGNVLLSTVDKNSKATFRLDGKNYDIMTKGVDVAIIDFTLSRIECEGVVIFNDLGLDPDLFTAEGDYQFEVYKLMQKKNGNNWQRFEPYTNLLWLHYTLDKALTALRYKNTQTKVHKEYLGKLRQLKDEILNYNSVKEFVLENF